MWNLKMALLPSHIPACAIAMFMTCGWNSAVFVNTYIELSLSLKKNMNILHNSVKQYVLDVMFQILETVCSGPYVSNSGNSMFWT
jgi:hypothetical protein